MVLQELVCVFAVDGMWSVEEFQLGAVADVQLVVMATDFAEFARDQFTRLAAVAMAGLDHKGTRRYQHGQLRIVGDVTQVPFGNLVLAGEDVSVAFLIGRDRLGPVGEVSRADRQAITIDKRRHAHRRFAAVRKAVERNAVSVDIWQ